MELCDVSVGADGEAWVQHLPSVLKLYLQKVCFEVDKEYFGRFILNRTI
jgi:hypothetical protein